MQEYIRRDKKQIVGKQVSSDTSSKQKSQEHIKKHTSKQPKEENNKVLFQCRTLFPFDLFPDKVIINHTILTYIHRSFFATEDTQDVRLSEITDASMTSAAFLARVEISIKHKDPLIISSLSTKNATRIKDILLEKKG